MEHSIDSSPDSGAKKSFPLEKSSGKNKGDLGLPSPDLGKNQFICGNVNLTFAHSFARTVLRNCRLLDRFRIRAARSGDAEGGDGGESAHLEDPLPAETHEAKQQLF